MTYSQTSTKPTYWLHYLSVGVVSLDVQSLIRDVRVRVPHKEKHFHQSLNSLVWSWWMRKWMRGKDEWEGRHRIRIQARVNQEEIQRMLFTWRLIPAQFNADLCTLTVRVLLSLVKLWWTLRHGELKKPVCYKAHRSWFSSPCTYSCHFIRYTSAVLRWTPFAQPRLFIA